MDLEQPGDRVGAILALGHRRVTRAFRAGNRLGYIAGAELQPTGRISLAALNLFLGKLAVGGWIEAGHAARNLAVGDRLDLERMQPGEGRNLVEGQGRV